jgi:hypothetical protein
MHPIEGMHLKLDGRRFARKLGRQVPDASAVTDLARDGRISQHLSVHARKDRWTHATKLALAELHLGHLGKFLIMSRAIIALRGGSYGWVTSDIDVALRICGVVFVLMLAGVVSIFYKPKRCSVCDAQINQVHHNWTIDGEQRLLCPNCNAQMKRKVSKREFKKKMGS